MGVKMPWRCVEARAWMTRMIIEPYCKTTCLFAMIKLGLFPTIIPEQASCVYGPNKCKVLNCS